MQPRVKGVAFRAVDSCYLALRGSEAHARARELLTPELRDAFASGLILAASWYPIDWYRDLLRSCRAASKDSIELMRTIGFESVKRDMSSIYKRLFARVFSPQLLFAVSARVFNTYYEQGKFEVPARSPCSRPPARATCACTRSWAATTATPRPSSKSTGPPDRDSSGVTRAGPNPKCYPGLTSQ
jgi:hypothetical protein